jgi:hypothetical protein
MARRRKDIKKRRQAQDELPVSAPAGELEELEEDVFEEQTGRQEIRDDEIVLQPDGSKAVSEPAVAAPKPVERGARDAGVMKAEAVSSGWFGQYKDNLLLGLLVIYVLLLGLGTVGELFEIEWVLDLPLFR